ncbi:MAG: hypothetical protein H0W87_04695, partial [Actinobacteria bacterium]|nr:hypothetical protein [Actinomycetota bacterium]
PLVITAPTHGRPVEPHGLRFRVAYALLAVVLGAAVGAFIVLMGRGSSSSGVAWSSWKPEGSDFVKTRDIASVVGGQYRLASGQQLVAVIPRIPPAVEPSTQETPISHIALAQSQAPEDIEVFSTDNSVEYVLCGIGSASGRCAIGEGKATVQRARLLHRESLELALYTFKYVDGVDSVVALQPPKVGSNPTYALFFRKDDFEEELDHPLKQTLEGASPFTTGDFPVAQQARVSQIVSPFLFRFSYQQAADLSAVLVLTPLAA